MKIKKTDVAHWLDANPQFKSRSMLRLGAFEYVKSSLGEVFTLDHVQMSNLVLRRMQELVPNNLAGEIMSAEYKVENGYVSKKTANEVLYNGVRFLIK